MKELELEMDYFQADKMGWGRCSAKKEPVQSHIAARSQRCKVKDL